MNTSYNKYHKAKTKLIATVAVHLLGALHGVCELQSARTAGQASRQS